MSEELEQKVLEAYRDGSEIGFMVECFNISHEEIKKIILNFRDVNRNKRTFEDDLKIVIAERDMNGIARSTIAKELEINVNTVKKACAKFGQALKEKTVTEYNYTTIMGYFDMDSCPTCNSTRVNNVDNETTYCKNCGNEHVHKEDHALRINWEYLD